MTEQRSAAPNVKFIQKIKKAGGENLKNCYQCATCSVVCNLSTEEKPFPRKEMILAQWGQEEKLVSDPDIWLCYQCNDCSTHCPRNAKPGDVLAALRSYVYEYYACPSFMGKLLASPYALPLLFLVPIVLMFGMMYGATGGKFGFVWEDKEAVYMKLLPHLWVEILFIGGNVLLFFFVLSSLWKFWNNMQKNGKSQYNFVESVFHTVKDILFHKHFSSCSTNKARHIAHLLVFWGFMGAMATAGLAAIGEKFFDFLPPIPMSHPIKWLGNASGFAGFLGLTILVVRRLTNKEKVGANGYQDWLFLIILYLVFITGLSTQFIRISGAISAAYFCFYIHMVLVFFLLWYAPYSKFGHIFYRTLALIYLKSVGRKSKCTA